MCRAYNLSLWNINALSLSVMRLRFYCWSLDALVPVTINKTIIVFAPAHSHRRRFNDPGN